MLAAVLLAASCSTTETTPTTGADSVTSASSDESSPVPWEPLPADGRCRAGLVLKPGESCLHEYSYESGFSISASGTSPIIEEVSTEFSVGADGEAYYGNRSWGDSVSYTLSFAGSTVGGEKVGDDFTISFIAYAQSDGTFYIEEATQVSAYDSQPDVPSCSDGMVLQEGDSCAVGDGAALTVYSDGRACLRPNFCFGTSIVTKDFSAYENDDGSWRIGKAPSTTTAVPTTAAPSTTAALSATTAAPTTIALPGEGVSVTMAQAAWPTAYFQAQVYEQLLEELGYDVSEPSETVLDPSVAYLAMAQGDVDFWANSWYPGHDPWWAPELPDGSVVGDHLTKAGAVFRGGGLQGLVITRSVADEYGITHLDQLNDDPAIRALFDSDGDGVAEFYGCPENWLCSAMMRSMIAFNGWQHLEQRTAGYDAMFAEAVQKADAGEPMAIYTWTPSEYITQLRPGDNVYWLAMENVLDDSNPLGLQGGENFDQRYPIQPDIPVEHCPARADAGICQLGWVHADIQVTANTAWLEANPAARKLFEVVKLPVVDASLATEMAGSFTGERMGQLAADWIAENRATVDGWIAAALSAPTTTVAPTTTAAPTTTVAPTTTAAPTTTVAPTTTAAPGVPACQVGMTLRPGDSCEGDTFTIRINDAAAVVLDGNIGGIHMGNTAMGGAGISLNNLRATRDGTTWTIQSLP